MVLRCKKYTPYALQQWQYPEADQRSRPAGGAETPAASLQQTSSSNICNHSALPMIVLLKVLLCSLIAIEPLLYACGRYIGCLETSRGRQRTGHLWPRSPLKADSCAYTQQHLAWWFARSNRSASSALAGTLCAVARFTGSFSPALASLTIVPSPMGCSA